MDYCCMDFGSFELQKCKKGTLFSSVLVKPGTKILRILSLFFNRSNLFHSIKKGQK